MGGGIKGSFFKVEHPWKRNQYVLCTPTGQPVTDGETTLQRFAAEEFDAAELVFSDAKVMPGFRGCFLEWISRKGRCPQKAKKQKRKGKKNKKGSVPFVGPKEEDNLRE